MNNCSCGQPAISERGLCETHFCDWLEALVWKTVEDFSMINPGERVLVAASGGKDSLTLLHILAKKYDVTAFCVDEGIAGYREKTIADLERFCKARNIPLLIKSFANEKGTTLDALHAPHPCTNCGIWRRELIASTARDFAVVATGHNLDDEAQAVMMNMARHHAMRPQPVLPANEMFVRRIKPLYFVPEADVRRYAYIHDFVSSFVECPNAPISFRRAIQEFLQYVETAHPGSKEALLRRYVASLSP